jgi:hypothetical protein
MGSVPRAERVRAPQALGLWCEMQLKGTEPPKDILEKLNFNSIEGMEIQLDNWKLREGLLDRRVSPQTPSRPGYASAALLGDGILAVRFERPMGVAQA